MLNDTRVRSAKSREKAFKLSDERGLFLLVMPTGSRLWRLKYRVNGREKLISLGAYPDVTLKRAREKRDVAADLIGALAPVKSKNFASVIDPVRVGELMRAIHGYSGHPVTALALKLAPLVFVRPGELRAAEWTEFDLVNAEWRIPGERMKMGDPHLVPLSRQALAILRELQPLARGGKYLF